MKKYKIPKQLIYFSGPLIILIIWKLISYFSLVSSLMLPSPESVMSVFLSEIKKGDLLRHVGVSVFRVLMGFGLASVVGISLGLLMGWFELARKFFDSIIEFLRPIPPIAWIPLAILWFGIGELSKIYLIAYGAFFPIVLNTILGVRSIDRKLLLLAKSMNLKGFELFKEVILPASFPSIFAGLRIGLGVGWMCLIAAELIAAQSGIGYMIEESKMLLLTNRVILGMIIIGFLGFLADRIIRLIEKKFVHWV
ncbi:MAG: ABC transporter permease [Candidatus Pacebacteria bacterium]|nr:ABC transporter permease [Candidatus Paceibacterota bacterium]